MLQTINSLGDNYIRIATSWWMKLRWSSYHEIGYSQSRNFVGGQNLNFKELNFEDCNL